MDFFHAKKTLQHLLQPLPFALIWSAAGAILWIRFPGRRIGPVVMISAALFLFLASLPAVGFFLIDILQKRAGPPVTPEAVRNSDIACVVAIGNVVAAVRLWEAMPDGTLIISSGDFTPVMVNRALSMGVPRNRIEVEQDARDTMEQARALAPRLNGAPFFLSTWALHMWRSEMAFEMAGAHPVPAPSDFLRPPQSRFRRYTPSAEGLSLSNKAFHEFGGIAWLGIRSLVLRGTQAPPTGRLMREGTLMKRTDATDTTDSAAHGGSSPPLSGRAVSAEPLRKHICVQLEFKDSLQGHPDAAGDVR